MKIQSLIFALFFSLISISLNGQSGFPENGSLYDLDEVPRIEVLIHADSLAEIFNNPHSDHEYMAKFVFSNSSVNDTVNSVGFRLRGNTSRDAQKKSFKVSFNTFLKGNKYQGVEKLNLNGEHNDPSSSRALLYWYLARMAGIAAPRANHVQLFINGNYFGLYTNVEHIDEEFAESYFGNKKGNLYKCLYPADLVYRGYHQDFYKFKHGDYRVYELKTNEELDDYNDLANFIDILNNNKAVDLPCNLEEVFNVQAYLKIAALDVLTGNWDGYIFNKNNFYLYNNPQSGLFEYIPYDVDNTFGIDWFNINWAERNIYNWNSNEPRPLFRRLLSIPVYKAQYTYYINELISIISSVEFEEYINYLRQQAQPYLVNDPYYPLDYGFDMSDYNQSWTEGFGAHVPVGILPFIEQRVQSAKSQSGTTDPMPIISRVKHKISETDNWVLISADVRDSDLNTVRVGYSVNGGYIQYKDMNDNGTDGDLLANDKIYSAVIDALPVNSFISYRIFASDLSHDESVKPCTPLSFTFREGVVADSFLVWPNPVSGNNLYFSKRIKTELFDHTGRLLYAAPEAMSIDISKFNSGLYYLRNEEGKTTKIIILH